MYSGQSFASTQDHGCLLPLAGWFAASDSCAVLKIDCNAHGITGSRTEMRAALDKVSWASLKALVVANCPRVDMASEVHAMTDLIRVEVYNSTVVAWAADAALTSSKHPYFASLVVVDSSSAMVEDGATFFFQGLARPPRSLVELAVVHSRFFPVDFPSDVMAHWPRSMLVFIWERDATTTAVPSLLRVVETHDLSLAGNQIGDVPDWLLADRPYWNVSLAANPITALPNVTLSSSVKRLFVENTSVSALPVAMCGSSREDAVAIYGAGAPVCTNAASDGQAAACDEFVVSCEAATGELSSFFFPLAHHRQEFRDSVPATNGA